MGGGGSWAGEGQGGREPRGSGSFHFPQPEKAGGEGRGRGAPGAEGEGRGKGGISRAVLRTLPRPRHLPRHNAVQSRHTLGGCPGDSPVSAPRNPCDACVSCSQTQLRPCPIRPRPPRLPLPGALNPLAAGGVQSCPASGLLVTGQGDARGWLYARSWVGPWLGVLSEGPWLDTGKNLRVS